MSIKIENFSTPGCTRCARARDSLKSVAEQFGQDHVTWREVNVLEEMAYAVKLGVIVPPSIAIDGKLVFPKLPTADKLREELMRRLRRTGNR